MADAGPHPDAPADAHRRRSASRPLIESLIVLVLVMLLIRTYTAEAYIVPTGSMAPTLLGAHREITCPECGFRLALGVDEAGHTGRPLCPNCAADLGRAAATERSGDRLLVHKFLYDWRAPKRWEVLVFQNPTDPGQAYVKRLVGLPGEAIEIVEGDVVVDGRVARKSLAEQRAIRMLVHDNRFRPGNDAWQARWPPAPEGGGMSRWTQADDGTFLHSGEGPTHPHLADLIAYRHVDPDRGDLGPVRDFVPYNGADMSSQEAVGDLMLDAQVEAGPGVESLVVRLRNRSALYRVEIPVSPTEPCRAWRNGEELELTGLAPGVASRALAPGRAARLEASAFDRRLLVALDGRLLFDPFDDDLPGPSAPPGIRSASLGSPIALGLTGTGGKIHRLKVFRDVYYTDGLAISPRRPFAVGRPYKLGPGEFFVLGDNSPVSNDSRFWPDSPVVRRELLLGKPFLVHLPSQGIPLKVFGQETYWVPDLREIRYIR